MRGRKRGEAPTFFPFSFSKNRNKVGSFGGKKREKIGEKHRKNRGRTNEFIFNGKKWGRKNAGWRGGGRDEFILNLHSYNEKT
ncbi:hypothetical protein A3Q36_12545 [Geobacillus stearothermophilus]|nr:hypothetical protein A3Q36_12545 [Geobacillus stearothermophilus]